MSITEKILSYFWILGCPCGETMSNKNNSKPKTWNQGFGHSRLSAAYYFVLAPGNNIIVN